MHPTNREWVLKDPLLEPAPRGQMLMLINEGGTLIQGHWYEGALAWGRKPVIPESVKARLTEQQKQQRERSNAERPKNR